MDTITKQFIIPIQPQASTKQQIIYPWESTNLYNLCLQLYELARNTGYTESFEEFKSHFGAYLEANDGIINPSEYIGEYSVTPLPLLEQILKTDNKVLRHDIVIEPIPITKVSNNAGGKTVTIG